MIESGSDILALYLDSRPTDVVPKGWKTVKQIAVEMEKSLPRASAIVRDLLASGKIERRVFRIITGQSALPVPHYKVTVKHKKT